jgi:hypothetical protein
VLRLLSMPEGPVFICLRRAGTKLVELLQSAGATRPIFAQVLDGNLVLGTNPFQPTNVIDFSGEIVRPLEDRDVGRQGPPQPEPALIPRRRLSRQGSGKYLLEIDDNTTEYMSLKEMLAGGLRTLEKRKPGTLDRLAAVKPRSKRIVAREPQGLFDQQALAKDYAEKLMEGWWYGTNNSADETNTWLKRACELAGLKWGKDVSTSL